MSKDDLFDQIGPPEEWLIPADDIAEIMTTGRCSHFLPSIEDCRPCFVGAMFERQIEILAKRLGCTPEDAHAVAVEAREQQERRR
jgi:hypothetical protein